MATSKPKVLFLCTANSSRSQMAEALLRFHAGDQFEVYSAGITPTGINPYAIRAMDEIGINIRSQYSKGSKEFMGQIMFRYLITVCGDADENCPQALWARSGKKLHWPFDDPAKATGTDEEIMAKFREIRDQIDAKIKSWLAELAVEEPAS